MTASELQNIARRLSNSTWCRYWLNWTDSHKPVIMAIQCRNAEGKPEKIADAESHGLTKHPDSEMVYIVTRTNDDGTMYESKIW